MTDRRTRIDDAIDRAVRDLVRRDPPAGFRGRVLSRLDAPARRTRLWPALATAAAALAVVMMVVMMREQAGAPAPQQAAVTKAAPSPAAAPAPAAQDRVTEPAATPRLRRAPATEPVRMATFGPREGRVSAASVREVPLAAAGTDEAVPEGFTMTAPPPIAVGAIEPPPPLAIQPIVVAPIHIPRLQQAPVSPPR